MIYNAKIYLLFIPVTYFVSYFNWTKALSKYDNFGNQHTKFWPNKTWLIFQKCCKLVVNSTVLLSACEQWIDYIIILYIRKVNCVTCVYCGPFVYNFAILHFW